MGYICPLCNCLETVEVKCDICGITMEDNGTVQQFFDDYSPYLNMDITRRIDQAPYDQCLHVFVCKGCGCWKKVAVNLVEY